jgi:hypothetical protein
MVFWYIFPHFGILYLEKSGNTTFYFCINVTYKSYGRSLDLEDGWALGTVCRSGRRNLRSRCCPLKWICRKVKKEPCFNLNAELAKARKTHATTSMCPAHVCTVSYVLFKNVFLTQCLNFSFSTHKQCILSQLKTRPSLCFAWKAYTLAGFEPGSCVLEADAKSATPRHAAPPGRR